MTEQPIAAPVPTAITLHETSRTMEVAFSSGERYRIPFELMRVYSPSAEVSGHGPGQEVLQTGKREVTITELEPMGNYAVRPTFSDGHNSGLFTWSLLYKLGHDQDELWNDYLSRLEAAGANRDTAMGRKPATTITKKKAHASADENCGEGSCGCSG
ncbi:MAG: hypothetical protein ABS45_02055 [Comamonas sp. SCN 65-56]|uniref:DUF971 domain-containing protein n=1 Tax=Comamonas sp. SCN 65-56 TaxID=1660095 RepID=UPI00086BD6EC|nr:DUF971 domain-containing protein [Comamonas sp. SCN 65-56]ODS93534.1 MAG: hypothetical protein ABS45_02055 [Comamonas sp. SCN 65-56]